MQEPRSFAYSLSQNEYGWGWRIYDEDGEMVAQGSAGARAAALSAVERRIQIEEELGSAAA